MCKGVYGLVPYSEQWGMRTLLYVLSPALHMLICHCILDSVFQVLASNAVVPLVAAGNKL